MADLELRRENAGFLPAPSELVLDDDTPRRVVLRARGDASTLPILLTPRAISADVELGPKTAEWPLDPVKITVRVRGPVSPGFAPTLNVRVNRVLAAVTWKHAGDTWTTEVAPQAPPGPWVVRVEALDEQGAPLGRGFLEVIAASVTITNKR